MSVRNLAIWGAIALLVIGMAVAMGGSSEADHADKAKLSEIYKLIDSGQITEATLGDQQIVVKTTDNRTLVSELRGLDMETHHTGHGVEVGNTQSVVPLGPGGQDKVGGIGGPPQEGKTACHAQFYIGRTWVGGIVSTFREGAPDIAGKDVGHQANMPCRYQYGSPPRPSSGKPSR